MSNPVAEFAVFGIRQFGLVNTVRTVRDAAELRQVIAQQQLYNRRRPAPLGTTSPNVFISPRI